MVRRVLPATLALLIVFFMAIGCGRTEQDHLQTSKITATVQENLPYKSGEVLVKFHPAVRAELVDFTVGPELGLQRLRLRTRLGVDRMRITTSETVEQTVQRIKRDPRVVYAEPNYRIKLLNSPNDPRHPECWGLNNTGQTGGIPDADIDAEEAWNISIGSRNVVVAVLDSGVDYTHPDLAANIWINTGEIPGNWADDDGNGYVDDVRGWDFEQQTNDPMDDYGHGTHCAGIIGAVGNNELGVAGVNWLVSIMALRIGGQQGTPAFCSDAAEAIIYAVDNGAQVMSCSWWTDQYYSQTLDDAVVYANQQGVLLVAAAGNDARDDDDPDYHHWPSEWPYENIIAVAATDAWDTLEWFSNWGRTTVDLGAPGQDVLSTAWPGGGYEIASGTSMAAPHVAGVAALLLSVDPDLTADEVKDIILTTVEPVFDLQGRCVSGGRLNAHLALQAVSGDPLPPVAMAGVDQHVFATSMVQLDGSGSFDSNQDPLTYTWTLFPPAGSSATLSDPNVVNPRFLADVCGDYRAELIVNDGTFDSQPDRVDVYSRYQNPTLIESSHPYSNDTDQTWTLIQPRAWKMAVHFAKFETEIFHDFVEILDVNNMRRAVFHGILGEFNSRSIFGDTLHVHFTSNRSNVEYGFVIDAYRWCDDGSCPAGTGDCDDNLSNGCETDLRFGMNNCGWCGHACSYPHATTDCLDRFCTILSCDADWADCDGIFSNGCEIDIKGDANNCGACGIACSFENATAVCQAGTCEIGVCYAGFEDCDGQAGNGCEVHFRSDKDNCGSCGNICSLPHATSKCMGGICHPDVCDAGWFDCDGGPSNGCESDPTSDPQNCGGCGRPCIYPHAFGVCTDGTCSMGVCHPSWGDCDSDGSNGCEVFTDTDVQNCGVCDFVCQLENAVPACIQGACRVAFCSGGFGNCDGADANGCEVDLSADAGNCGSCGTVCSFEHSTAQCNDEVCELGPCLVGWDNCNGLPADGCEVNTAADVQNCGSCRNACVLAHATPACSGGTCIPIVCDAGWGNCNASAPDGCETDLASQINHCGSCGNACAFDNAAASCIGGTCIMGACRAGFDNCDGLTTNGCETELNTNPNHCGACGHACSFDNAAALCNLGRCALGACSTGYANCNSIASDGCEIDQTTDADNCGDCGNACAFDHAAASCAAGICVLGLCQAGFDNCDGLDATGCEADLAMDPAHCGVCGSACAFDHAGAICADGACVLGPCEAGFDDCDGLAQNGCEVELAVDPLHCGACGSACALTNATAGCLEGACTVAACDDGFADCNLDAADGCEVDQTADPENCDSCGNACGFENAVALCQEGSCVMGDCSESYADCNQDSADGCEADLQNDPENCESCGSVCGFDNAAALCLEGVCTPGECLEGYGDCDADPQTGCEADLSSDAEHCGLCAAACAPGEICDAGACACADGDGDGYLSGECGGGDCDDGDAGVHPGAVETCDDGIDQDCSGSDLHCGCTDTDGDGFAAVHCGGDDCNDENPNIFPGAGELCGDDVDQDCDGEDLKCQKVDKGCGCGTSADRQQFLYLLLVFAAFLMRRR